MSNPCKHSNVEQVNQYTDDNGMPDGTEMWWCVDCGAVKYVDLRSPTLSGRWRTPRLLRRISNLIPEEVKQEAAKLAP